MLDDRIEFLQDQLKPGVFLYYWPTASLDEAVAEAWRIFAESEWNAHGRRPPLLFVVKVKHPEIEDKLRIQDFETWLAAAPESPAEWH
jgi:hypothetical protein